MDALVLGLLVPSETSLAVTVRPPVVFKVILKVPAPTTRAALLGKLALLSEALIPTVALALVTKFQLASTALTVTVNGLPAVWLLGKPVLPLVLPGAATSPGASTCSLVKAPALTVT